MFYNSSSVNNKNSKFKIKKWLFFFIFLLIEFTLRKTHEFRDFSPTVIGENQTFYKTDSKIFSEFRAKHDNLGTVSFKFNVSKSSSNNRIIFKIKNKNQDHWFYENTYPIDPSLQNDRSFFPFGFPIIENSKNQIYQIEISSTDENINSLYSKTCGISLLTKYSFPKAYLLQNKNKIPEFVFSKTKSFFHHLNLFDLLSIFIILLIFIKLSSTKFFKEITKTIKTVDESKIISSEKKLLFSFPLFLLINIFIVSLLITLKGHTESNEWLIYEITSITTFVGSILFFKFSSKINQKFIKFFLITSSAISLFVISYWFVSEKISLRYLIVILGLSLLSAFFYYKKNITSFLKIYFINTFLAFNIIYFFILDIDKLNIFVFFCLLLSICTLFLIFRNYKFQTNKSKFLKIIIFTVFIIIASLIIFFRRDIEYHHYSFYIGPAYEITHNKSILNDFPSQYGYLPIHLISFLLKPFNITFESFHILNLIFFVIYFVLFYLIYTKLTKNLILAFFTSIITILTQTIFSIHSSYLGPSVGFFRFGPGLLIIILLLYLPKKIKNPAISIISAITLFWSAETAVYVIPSWAFFVFYSHFQQGKQFIKNTFKSYLFFLTCVVTTLLIISIYEYRLTNQLPIFSNLIQYSLAYQEGLCSELIPLVGNHFITITILLSGILITTYFLVKKQSDNLINTLSFVSIHNTAIFSYFVSRSNQNNTLNIFPFLIVEFFIICKIIKEKFNIKLYKYIALPIFIYTVFLISKSIQNEFSINSQIIRQKQKSPDILEQYDSIKNLYSLNQNNVLIISKDFDGPIILNNKIKTVLPLNPSQMTLILKDKYLNPNFNKVSIGTTIVYTNDYPELFNMINNHYKLQEVKPKTNNKTFILYTIESIR